MSQKKYASLTTLQNFLDNLKNLFATKTDVNTALSSKADSSHAHAISDVTELQTALDTLTENKSDSTHTHTDATTSTSGMMSAADKVKLDGVEEGATNGIQRINMTSEDGVAFTATIDGVEELTAGMTFLFIPDRTTSSTTLTLNVNNLGDVAIRRKLSSGTATLTLPVVTTQLYQNRPTLLMYDTAMPNGTPYWIPLEFTKPVSSDLYGKVPVQNGGWYSNANTTTEDLTEAREAFGVYSKEDHELVQIYDSGEITEAVNAISGIDISGYKNIKIAVQNVNDGTNTTTANAGIIFTSQSGTTYQFNVFNSLFNATSGRIAGGMAHFNVRSGWLTCEYSLYNYNISNGVFTDTEGGTAAKFSAFSGGGIAKCTSDLSTVTVTSYNQDTSCFFGVGSRVVVWGCKI